MGYSTRYTIDATQQAFDALRESSEDALYAFDDDGEAEEDCKWYDHEEEVAAVSADFPDERITLCGAGEEAGDVWKKYFVAGKIQRAQATLVFDDFDPKKLGSI